jgi:hypothetical protein
MTMAADLAGLTVLNIIVAGVGIFSGGLHPDLLSSYGHSRRDEEHDSEVQETFASRRALVEENRCLAPATRRNNDRASCP